MFPSPTQPLSVGQVLDQGFRLFKASFSRVWALALAAAIAGMVWSGTVGYVALNTEQVSIPAVAALAVVYAIISLVIFGAICCRIDAVSHNQSLSLGESLNIGLRRGPALFVTGLLYALCVLVGLLLLIVPGIYVSIAMIYAVYVAVIDRKGPIESLKYSMQLVKGLWWRTAILVTIIAIIAGVIYGLLGFIVGVLAATGSTAEEALDAISAIETVLMPLIQVVLVPLSYALFIALLNDARLRHEGSDLLERIDATE